MVKYIIGALVGGVLGYVVLYRIFGCSTGTCPITANPYISIVLGVVLGVLIAGILVLPGKQSTVYKRITAEEAKARIDSGDEIIILDVRTEEEYNAGHIPNAILIPNETIGDKMPELLPDLNTEILIYCRSGNRSAHAAKKLIAIGYTNVYDFGGIISWPYGTVKKELVQ
ncbi:MAG: rhodanese-like domain-containing protein [Clostridiales bacterium]|jgi:phage shock protein E|nr:rhodanese-like domain-containing protein [Clostridiales bacterium]